MGDAPCVYLVLIFDYDLVVGAQQEPEVFSPDVLFDNPLNAGCPGYRQLCRLLFALYRERERDTPGLMLVKHGLVQQFSGLLVRSQRYIANAEAGQRLERSRAMIECTFQLIQERYSQPLTRWQPRQLTSACPISAGFSRPRLA